MAIAVASAIWYGIVTVIAYRVGSDWPTLQARLRGAGATAALIAGAITILVVVWYVLKRRRTVR